MAQQQPAAEAGMTWEEWLTEKEKLDKKVPAVKKFRVKYPLTAKSVKEAIQVIKFFENDNSEENFHNRCDANELKNAVFMLFLRGMANREHTPEEGSAIAELLYDSLHAGFV